MTRKPRKITARHNSYRPHMVAQALTLMLCVVIVTAGAIIFSPSHQPTSPLPRLHPSTTHYPGPLTIQPFSQSVLGAQPFSARDFVAGINVERAKTGAGRLRMNTALTRAAQWRADIIMRYENFSHGDPHEHIELGTVLPKVNYHFTYATENIGMGGQSAADFVNGFMNSESHRINLLNPQLSDTGVGSATGKYQQYYVTVVVQIFAVPGGVDEYLGYSHQEEQRYESTLALIQSELIKTKWLRYITFWEAGTLEGKERRLKKQEAILLRIITPMRHSQPLTNDHVALIDEYNTTLTGSGT